MGGQSKCAKIECHVCTSITMHQWCARFSRQVCAKNALEPVIDVCTNWTEHRPNFFMQHDSSMLLKVESIDMLLCLGSQNVRWTTLKSKVSFRMFSKTKQNVIARQRRSRNWKSSSLNWSLKMKKGSLKMTARHPIFRPWPLYFYFSGALNSPVHVQHRPLIDSSQMCICSYVRKVEVRLASAFSRP